MFTLARDLIGSSVIGGVIVIRKAVDCYFLALFILSLHPTTDTAHTSVLACTDG
jgi:hypothetical protein